MAQREAATRTTVIRDFELALQEYAKLTDPAAKFDLITGDLMRAANRGYQIARAEKLEGSAPTVTEPEPAVAVDDEVDLTKLTRSELRELAKERNIHTTSRTTKAELLAQLV